MAYSHFTSLQSIKQKFHLTIDENTDLFASVNEVEVSQFLAETLKENIPLALAIHTEKARSELIIMPLLVELRKLLNHQISLFSGVDFEVDPPQGLTGVCDFIVCRSTEQFFISAPILVIVEAKNENIKGGLGQCMAAMIAAKLFNEREGNDLAMVYGAITTGNIWRFVKLEKDTAFIDRREYYIERVGKILGILLNMVGLETQVYAKV